MNALEKMIAHKRREIQANKMKIKSLPSFARGSAGCRDFKKAISRPGRISVIAELKRRSPSAGLLIRVYDPAGIARVYEDGGAGALSVLTDQRFFGGTATDLVQAKRSVGIPVMRKDFIIDDSQVLESFLLGADCILLIARALGPMALARFVDQAKKLGMASLVEIHDRHDLEWTLTCGADIIGVNNRDLTDFSVDIRTALELKPMIPADCVTVCESGIRSGDDVAKIRDAGFDAVLVGEALMRSPRVRNKMQELICAR